MNLPPQEKPGMLVEWFRALCREAGLRTTPQRLDILKAILQCPNHPTAEQVHQIALARMPTLSLDTVYRTLALLERHGILVRLWGPDGRCHFDPNREPHHHLTCQECGRIEDFQWAAFDALQPPSAAGEWGRVSRVRIEMRGVCARCLRNKGRRRKQADAHKPPLAERPARGRS
jgi:Fur family transcriptional regulator, peroxide stress response regulator